MTINGVVQYTRVFLPYILLFTQAPILVWFDGTMIGISTCLEYSDTSMPGLSFGRRGLVYI